MALTRQGTGYFDTEEALDARKLLEEMAENVLYNTASSYSSDSAQYPDNKRSFVEKHLHYLNTHPKLDPKMYIANLRLMTRIR